MNIEELKKINNKTILVFGDLMVDKYITGNVSRISPEAPVPILAVTNKQSKLGGAGNVINNVTSLGGKTKILGCVGNDEDGSWITKTLSQRGIDISYLKCSDEVKTISKTRLVSKNQQFLRFDEEIIKDIPKSYEEYVIKNIEEIFADVDVLVVSDYGKGTVTKTLCEFLIQTANKKNIPSIVDPKGTDYSKYFGATVCTPNVNELKVVTGKKADSEDEILAAGKKLLKDTNLKYLMLTRSEKGISLFTKGEEEKQDFPAISKDVVDVSGAGDTVVSTVALLLAAGFTAQECCVLANFSASIVCSKFGTATLSLNELMETVAHSGEFKLIDVTTAKYIVAALKEKGKKAVFTNGCFDLLHAGHLSSFLQAKKFGDVLIVAVNSDKSVKRIKGDLRPVISETDRIKMLCALECVDYVIVMEDNDPSAIISEIKPDIAVKGKDWQGKKMPELDILNSYGGKMEYIELDAGHSTTNIIEKIIKAYE